MLEGSGVSFEKDAAYPIAAGDAIRYPRSGAAAHGRRGSRGHGRPGVRLRLGQRPDLSPAREGDVGRAALDPAGRARARSRSRWRPARWSLPEPTAERPADDRADRRRRARRAPARRHPAGHAQVRRRARVRGGRRADDHRRCRAGSPTRRTATAASDELFVVLRGDGALELLHPDGTAESPPGPRRPRRSRARPAPAIAHVFGAGDDGLELLAYGHNDPSDMCFYPRSGKISIGGLKARRPRPARGLLGRGGMSPRPAALFDHELLVVTGKGGVGKTTVSTALGRGRGAPRAAGDRRRGRGARRRDAHARRRARGPRPGGRAGLRRAPHVDRAGGRDARVPDRPAALAHARRAAHGQPRVRGARRGGPGDARAADDRQGLGARAGGPPDARSAAVRSRDPRCSRNRPRRRRPVRAAHLRRDGARRPHRAPGGEDRRARHERAAHRRRRRRAAGGAARQRDARSCATRSSASSGCRCHSRSSTASSPIA